VQDSSIAESLRDPKSCVPPSSMVMLGPYLIQEMTDEVEGIDDGGSADEAKIQAVSHNFLLGRQTWDE